MVRAAGSPASIAPTIVAALAGAALGGVAGAVLGDPYRVAQSAILASAMTAIAWEDARRFKVPDAWALVAALAGLAAVGFGASTGFGAAAGLSADAGGSANGLPPPLAAVGCALLQAALCGGAFLALREAFFRLRGVEGLGFGDVKLAAAAGIWLGWQLFALAVMLAAIGALAFVAAHAATGRAWPRARRIPLAAFLAPAVWLCWWGVAG